MPHPVDISYEVLKYLKSIGYSRAKFVLSENHPRPDICDEVASRFSGDSSFITLDNLIANAPIFTNKQGKTSPPAPIYGLTHVSCRCRLVVFPPQTTAELIIPGSPDEQQKAEILSKMYPQEVYALSTQPRVMDRDFSKYINIPVERPVEKTELKKEPWYQKAWDWVKKKVFRKSVDYMSLIRYAESSVFRTGDLIRTMDDYVSESELGIGTPIQSGSHGLYLADYEYDKELGLIYIAEYNTIRAFPKASLVPITNNDIDDEFLYKKVVIYNDAINDNIDGIVVRVMDEGKELWVFDMIKDTVVKLPVDKVTVD